MRKNGRCGHGGSHRFYFCLGTKVLEYFVYLCHNEICIDKFMKKERGLVL